MRQETVLCTCKAYDKNKPHFLPKLPNQSDPNEAGNQKEICCDQAYTTDRPTSSLVL